LAGAERAITRGELGGQRRRRCTLDSREACARRCCASARLPASYAPTDSAARVLAAAKSAPPQTPAPRVSSTPSRRSNCARSIANLAVASGLGAGAAVLPGAGVLPAAPSNGAGAAAAGSLA